MTGPQERAAGKDSSAGWLGRLWTGTAAQSSLLLFTGSNLGLQAALITCQIWVLRYIAPEQIGLYQLGMIIYTYAAVSQLGIANGMNRDYPYYLGKGDQEAVAGILGTGQAFALLNGVFIGVVLLTVGVVLWARGSDWRLVILTLALLAPVRGYQTYLEGTFRAKDEFRRLAGTRLAQVPLHFLAVLLPIFWGFSGFCLRELLIGVTPALLCHLVRPVRVRPSLRWDTLKRLFSTGWRLFLWNYLQRVGQSFARLVLVTLGGVRHLGLFTPVSWMFVALTGISGSVSAFVYPRLTYRHAREEIPVASLALHSALLTMAALAPVVIVGVLLLPWLLPSLIPKYIAAIRPAQITLVAGLIECIRISTVSFAVKKAWGPLTWYLGLSLLFRGLGPLAGYLLFEDKLLGVAWGMLGTSVVLGFTTWATVTRTDRAPGI